MNNSIEESVKEDVKRVHPKNVASVYLLNIASVLLPFCLIFTLFFVVRNGRRECIHDGVKWHRDKAKSLSIIVALFDVSVIVLAKFLSGVFITLFACAGISFLIYKNVHYLLMLVEHEIEE